MGTSLLPGEAACCIPFSSSASQPPFSGPAPGSESEAWAQKDRPVQVLDDANLFSKDAKNQANRIIASIKQKHHKDLLIETVEKGPESKKAEAWALERFDTHGIDGVYVVISKSPGYFRFVVGDNTRTKGYFVQRDQDKLESILKNKKSFDDVLIQVANHVSDAMNEHAQAKTKSNTAPRLLVPAPAPPAPHGDGTHSGASPWLGWVCMIVGVLLVVWVVFAIIRAVAGWGGGGGGYGAGPGYSPGYGGGGGGFFSSLMGGLFGAAAGMWLYNNFFGGHSSPTYTGDPHSGSQGGSTPPAGSDYQADTVRALPGGGDWDDQGGGGGGGGGGSGGAGGGDWGGDNGGGGGGAGGGDDWGGGGGGGADFGGGGDAGGGGDWGGGGGGGDAGGGGRWRLVMDLRAV